ncbi:hypothetical protein DIPPA_35536 [Diplonema papillatum]|nr:hypothetical protein DIPPA_35536 [Diplonema papillatum]
MGKPVLYGGLSYPRHCTGHPDDASGTAGPRWTPWRLAKGEVSYLVYWKAEDGGPEAAKAFLACDRCRMGEFAAHRASRLEWLAAGRVQTALEEAEEDIVRVQAQVFSAAPPGDVVDTAPHKALVRTLQITFEATFLTCLAGVVAALPVYARVNSRKALQVLNALGVATQPATPSEGYTLEEWAAWEAEQARDPVDRREETDEYTAEEWAAWEAAQQTPAGGPPAGSGTGDDAVLDSSGRMGVCAAAPQSPGENGLLAGNEPGEGTGARTPAAEAVLLAGSRREGAAAEECAAAQRSPGENRSPAGNEPGEETGTESPAPEAVLGGSRREGSAAEECAAAHQSPGLASPAGNGVGEETGTTAGGSEQVGHTRSPAKNGPGGTEATAQGTTQRDEYTAEEWAAWEAAQQSPVESPWGTEAPAKEAGAGDEEGYAAPGKKGPPAGKNPVESPWGTEAPGMEAGADDEEVYTPEEWAAWQAGQNPAPAGSRGAQGIDNDGMPRDSAPQHLDPASAAENEVETATPVGSDASNTADPGLASSGIHEGVSPPSPRVSPEGKSGGTLAECETWVKAQLRACGGNLDARVDGYTLGEWALWCAAKAREAGEAAALPAGSSPARPHGAKPPQGAGTEPDGGTTQRVVEAASSEGPADTPSSVGSGSQVHSAALATVPVSAGTGALSSTEAELPQRAGGQAPAVAASTGGEGGATPGNAAKDAAETGARQVSSPQAAAEAEAPASEGADDAAAAYAQFSPWRLYGGPSFGSAERRTSASLCSGASFDKAPGPPKPRQGEAWGSPFGSGSPGRLSGGDPSAPSPDAAKASSHPPARDGGAPAEAPQPRADTPPAAGPLGDGQPKPSGVSEPSATSQTLPRDQPAATPPRAPDSGAAPPTQDHPRPHPPPGSGTTDPGTATPAAVGELPPAGGSEDLGVDDGLHQGAAPAGPGSGTTDPGTATPAAVGELPPAGGSEDLGVDDGLHQGAAPAGPGSGTTDPGTATPAAVGELPPAGGSEDLGVDDGLHQGAAPAGPGSGTTDPGTATPAAVGELPPAGGSEDLGVDDGLHQGAAPAGQSPDPRALRCRRVKEVDPAWTPRIEPIPSEADAFSFLETRFELPLLTPYELLDMSRWEEVLCPGSAVRTRPQGGSRRPPREYWYAPEVCESVLKRFDGRPPDKRYQETWTGACNNSCQSCHTWDELALHPLRYKTEPCVDGHRVTAYATSAENLQAARLAQFMCPKYHSRWEQAGYAYWRSAWASRSWSVLRLVQGMQANVTAAKAVWRVEIAQRIMTSRSMQAASKRAVPLKVKFTRWNAMRKHADVIRAASWLYSRHLAPSVPNLAWVLSAQPDYVREIVLRVATGYDKTDRVFGADSSMKLRPSDPTPPALARMKRPGSAVLLPGTLGRKAALERRLYQPTELRPDLIVLHQDLLRDCLGYLAQGYPRDAGGVARLGIAVAQGMRSVRRPRDYLSFLARVAELFCGAPVQLPIRAWQRAQSATRAGAAGTQRGRGDAALRRALRLVKRFATSPDALADLVKEAGPAAAEPPLPTRTQPSRAQPGSARIPDGQVSGGQSPGAGTHGAPISGAQTSDATTSCDPNAQTPGARISSADTPNARISGADTPSAADETGSPGRQPGANADLHAELGGDAASEALAMDGGTDAETQVRAALREAGRALSDVADAHVDRASAVKETQREYEEKLAVRAQVEVLTRQAFRLKGGLRHDAKGNIWDESQFDLFLSVFGSSHQGLAQSQSSDLDLAVALLDKTTKKVSSQGVSWKLHADEVKVVGGIWKFLSKLGTFFKHADAPPVTPWQYHGEPPSSDAPAAAGGDEIAEVSRRVEELKQRLSSVRDAIQSHARSIQPEIEPEASSIQPEASTIQPEITSIQPETSSIQCETSTIQPEASSIQGQATSSDRQRLEEAADLEAKIAATEQQLRALLQARGSGDDDEDGGAGGNDGSADPPPEADELEAGGDEASSASSAADQDGAAGEDFKALNSPHFAGSGLQAVKLARVPIVKYEPRLPAHRPDNDEARTIVIRIWADAWCSDDAETNGARGQPALVDLQARLRRDLDEDDGVANEGDEPPRKVSEAALRRAIVAALGGAAAVEAVWSKEFRAFGHPSAAAPAQAPTVDAAGDPGERSEGDGDSTDSGSDSGSDSDSYAGSDELAAPPNPRHHAPTGVAQRKPAAAAGAAALGRDVFVRLDSEISALRALSDLAAPAPEHSRILAGFSAVAERPEATFASVYLRPGHSATWALPLMFHRDFDLSLRFTGPRGTQYIRDNIRKNPGWHGFFAVVKNWGKQSGAVRSSGRDALLSSYALLVLAIDFIGRWCRSKHLPYEYIDPLLVKYDAFQSGSDGVPQVDYLAAEHRSPHTGEALLAFFRHYGWDFRHETDAVVFPSAKIAKQRIAYETRFSRAGSWRYVKKDHAPAWKWNQESARWHTALVVADPMEGVTNLARWIDGRKLQQLVVLFRDAFESLVDASAQVVSSRLPQALGRSGEAAGGEVSVVLEDAAAGGSQASGSPKRTSAENGGGVAGSEKPAAGTQQEQQQQYASPDDNDETAASKKPASNARAGSSPAAGTQQEQQQQHTSPDDDDDEAAASKKPASNARAGSSPAAGTQQEQPQQHTSPDDDDDDSKKPASNACSGSSHAAGTQQEQEQQQHTSPDDNDEAAASKKLALNAPADPATQADRGIKPALCLYKRDAAKQEKADSERRLGLAPGTEEADAERAIARRAEAPLRHLAAPDPGLRPAESGGDLYFSNRLAAGSWERPASWSERQALAMQLAHALAHETTAFRLAPVAREKGRESDDGQPGQEDMPDGIEAEGGRGPGHAEQDSDTQSDRTSCGSDTDEDAEVGAGPAEKGGTPRKAEPTFALCVTEASLRRAAADLEALVRRCVSRGGRRPEPAAPGPDRSGGQLDLTTNQSVSTPNQPDSTTNQPDPTSNRLDALFPPSLRPSGLPDDDGTRPFREASERAAAALVASGLAIAAQAAGQLAPPAGAGGTAEIRSEPEGWQEGSGPRARPSGGEGPSQAKHATVAADSAHERWPQASDQVRAHPPGPSQAKHAAVAVGSHESSSDPVRAHRPYGGEDPSQAKHAAAATGSPHESWPQATDPVRAHPSGSSQAKQAAVAASSPHESWHPVSDPVRASPVGGEGPSQAKHAAAAVGDGGPPVAGVVPTPDSHGSVPQAPPPVHFLSAAPGTAPTAARPDDWAAAHRARSTPGVLVVLPAGSGKGGKAGKSGHPPAVPGPGDAPDTPWGAASSKGESPPLSDRRRRSGDLRQASAAPPTGTTPAPSPWEGTRPSPPPRPPPGDVRVSLDATSGTGRAGSEKSAANQPWGGGGGSPAEGGPARGGSLQAGASQPRLGSGCGGSPAEGEPARGGSLQGGAPQPRPGSSWGGGAPGPARGCGEEAGLSSSVPGATGRAGSARPGAGERVDDSDCRSHASSGSARTNRTTSSRANVGLGQAVKHFQRQYPTLDEDIVRDLVVLHAGNPDRIARALRLICD